MCYKETVLKKQVIRHHYLYSNVLGCDILNI